MVMQVRGSGSGGVYEEHRDLKRLSQLLLLSGSAPPRFDLSLGGNQNTQAPSTHREKHPESLNGLM